MRKKKRLTLQEVGKLTGLSVGFLSQVEHDQSTPSLSSLRKIAEALDTTLFTLLAPGDRGATVIKSNERTVVTKAGSNVPYQVASPRDRQPRMELSCVLLEPDQQTAEQAISHEEGEECAYVLKGTIVCEVGSETYQLQTGDSVYFNSQIPHKYGNDMDSDAIVLICTSPPLL